MSNKLHPLHKKWTWRKPKGKPKRPLSAYNIFFSDVRHDLLTARNNEDGIGFQNLAQAVARQWKDLDPELKIPYVEKAKIAMAQYKVKLSLWKETEALKVCMLPLNVDATVLNEIIPSPVTPVKSRNLRIETSNDMTSNLPVSQFSPLSYSRALFSTNHTPSHTHNNNTCTPQDRTNKSMYNEPALMDNVCCSSANYLADVSNQSTLHCYDGTEKVCVTPSIQHNRRQLCSMNDPEQYNIMYDDTYEPLPLSTTLGHYNNRFSLPADPAEESCVVQYPYCEGFPLAFTATPQMQMDHNNSGYSTSSSNKGINQCYSHQIEPIQNRSNVDGSHNFTWDAIQLENLFQTLENEERKELWRQ